MVSSGPYKTDPLPPLAGVNTAGGSASIGDGDGMSFNLEEMRRAARGGNVDAPRPPDIELRDEVPAGARRPRAAIGGRGWFFFSDGY